MLFCLQTAWAASREWSLDQLKLNHKQTCTSLWPQACYLLSFISVLQWLLFVGNGWSGTSSIQASPTHSSIVPNSTIPSNSYCLLLPPQSIVLLKPSFCLSYPQILPATIASNSPAFVEYTPLHRIEQLHQSYIFHNTNTVLSMVKL